MVLHPLLEHRGALGKRSRAAAALLRTINRLRRAISFGWLRRG